MMPANAATTSALFHLPSLTDSKCMLLNEHEGCTMCRCFYAGHHSQSCPNSFPVSKGYKMLMLTDALAAKKAKAITKSSVKAVAAMIETISLDKEIAVPAAVLPDSSGKFDSDSEEYDNLSDRDVSDDLCVKHLLWECQVHSLTSDFPMKTHVLIDNGAHLVLVQPKVVTQLGLKTYRLHKPKVVDVMFSNGKKKKTKLYDYVKLSLVSLDAQLTAKTVRALVAPGLCTSIILGLPWLVKNSIFTDHATRTCIDKINVYDLLNPPVIVPPPPPKPCLHEQLKETKPKKKLVLAELMMVCNNRLKDPKLKPEKVKDFNVAGAVQHRIEMLALTETLKRCQQKLRTEYNFFFKPIPHMDELP
jgi:hypothetical protein